ncbi:MAG: hypothetical protein PVJ57_14760 [Phycisphaerae bacterium]
MLTVLLLVLTQAGCYRSANGHSPQPAASPAPTSEPAEADLETETLPEKPAQAVASAQTKTYENESYGFRLVVPADWDVGAEPKGLLPQGQSEGIVFTLPPVWSELENASIRNAVSVKAIRLSASSTAEDFAMTYAQSDSDGRISSQSVEGFARPAYVEEVNWRGLTYKRRLEFEIREGIGYVLEFTATPGTYDQNYSKFRPVADNAEFFPPQQGSTDADSP